MQATNQQRFLPLGACALLQALGLLWLLWGLPAGAQTLGTDITQGLKEGRFDLAFRYRYEFVDDAGFANNANASILWSRLTYRSAPIRDFALTLNMDNVTAIAAKDYNSTRNGKSQFPLVPDPTGTDLNLASLTYTGLEHAEIVVGRQLIKRANDRFVSNVPWRQNETTYDAASITVAVSDQLTVFYSYADRVKRAFGPDAGTPSAEFSGPVHLLDATLRLGPGLSVIGYGYWLDFAAAPEAPALSSRTIGTRLDGVRKLGDRWSLTYTAEYARQSDYGANPNAYQANYYDLEIGLRRDGFGVRGAYEVLSGATAPGKAMQTPLGLVHAFQGWADKFAVTPPGGVTDIYVAADLDLFRGSFSLIYHDFSAEAGSSAYGHELDFSAAWPVAEHYTLWAGFARYAADGFSTDTDKIWVMVSARF